MTDVALHMWEPFRQSLLAQDSFYVEQATTRLLSQFELADEVNVPDWFEKAYQQDHKLK